MIELYQWPKPVGTEVLILMIESGLPYRSVCGESGHGALDNSLPRRLANRDDPVIVDTFPEDGGEPLAVFGSAAIMTYVAEKAGLYYPRSARYRQSVDQCLAWLNLHRALPDDRPDDLRGQLALMDDQLRRNRYIAWDYFSIADVACFGWIADRGLQRPDFEALPCLFDWFDEVSRRPAVQCVVGVR